MGGRTSGLAHIVACELIVLAAGTPVAAGQSSATQKGDGRQPSSPATTVEPSKPGTGRLLDGERISSRILISDRATTRALEPALVEAWKQLSEAGCQALLTEFTDQRGHALVENIPKDAGSLQNYLARIVFVDGRETKSCAKGALAVTEPGSRVVRVCGSRLVWTWQQNSRHVVAALIHEALHTLGLGENPPSSDEITSRVLKRCGRN